MNDIDTYKEDPGKFYSSNFFSRMKRLRAWQAPLAEKISNLYSLKSVIDFGCANGYYLEGFQKAGASIRGFEYLLENAWPFIPEEVKPFISKGNLMEEIKCKPADLAMSIEVAEHLLPEKSDVFVDNLVRAGNKYVMLTAAPPGQGGTAHINEQPKEYWISKLEERGFKYSLEDIKKIRTLFTGIPGITRKYPKLIKKQIMFFTNENDIS